MALVPRELEVQVVALLQPALKFAETTRVRQSSPLKRSSFFVDRMCLHCCRGSREDVNVSPICSSTQSASFPYGSFQRTSTAARTHDTAASPVTERQGWPAMQARFR